MAQTITMPKLGFDMAEGTLVRWVKAEGEAIQKGDIIAEIETDKATLEIDSAYSGVVAHRLVEEGAVVPVGNPIAIIAEPGEKVEAQPVTEAAPTAASEVIAQPKHQSKPEEAKPQQSPGTEAVPPATAAAPQPVTVTPSTPAAEGRVLASPLARHIAEEKGISLEGVKGSGPNGRIVKHDLETVGSATPQATPSMVSKPAPVPQTQAAAPFSGEDVSVPLTRLRSAIGRRMAEAKQTIPHFYVSRSFEVDQMLELRKQMNSQLPEGEKISVNDFVVKAAALALRQFPNLNASLGADAIIRHAHVNIGIAVSVEGGLLTVVVRDADIKSLRQISRESAERVARARDGKVKPEDIEGSTFSVSNLGMYQVDEFSAIINPPEVAILAVSAAKPQPVVKDGKIEIETLMAMTLSADHRVSDGVEATKFMQALAELIENPWRIVL